MARRHPGVPTLGLDTGVPASNLRKIGVRHSMVGYAVISRGRSISAKRAG